MKQSIGLGMVLGGAVGGLIPNLWNAGMLSFSSLVFSTAGAIGGIWLAYRLTR